MKLIDDKLTFLRDEVTQLAEHCDTLGDEKTRQLLLEIDELLEYTHKAFLGKTLTSFSNMPVSKHGKH
jgi:hypothetical protein